MFVLLCNLGQRYSDIRRISPENFERNLFRIIRQKTGNKAIVDIDRYAIIPKLTYSLLKKYGYHSPYTSSVSNYDRYLHSLLKEIGEEFNDTVITEVKTANGNYAPAIRVEGPSSQKPAAGRNTLLDT